MSSSTVISYPTWHKDPRKEAAMADGHRPYWRHFIETIPESDLGTRTVLDFGCNRGGFLRLLHALRPFRRGVGVDIAAESIREAKASAGDAPLQFEVATDLAAWRDTFDIAFSYEVIYLLPDLKFHAEQVWSALRDGGVYYAVTGCHTENPLWPRFREAIGKTSSAPVQDYAPDDFVQAFAAAGFGVSAKRFGYDGFVAATSDRTYYPSIVDAIDYSADHKLLFRLEKRLD